MNSKNIIDFYNNFVARQKESGINDRIIELYKRLKGLGLKSGSNVLELGSGIGTMTFLLSKRVKKGRIETVDISPDSVQFSKQWVRKPNIIFSVNDIVSHVPSIQNIDFITLFDVIEHIPIDRHAELFKNLESICNENTKILINIPNPGYIEFDMANNAKALQIIDQPLPLHFILKNIDENGLNLVSFETYSVWVENDYQFFVINKKRFFKEVKLSDKRTVMQKIIRKVEQLYLKLKYNYP